MTATILGTWPDGSEQWHAAREGRVGGSEVGTICGWSPWESRAQLLHRKAGLLAPRPQTSAMQRGHLLEPAILAFLVDKHGLVIDTEASAATYAHTEHDRWLYNPDAIAGEALLEAKSTSQRSEDDGWGRAGTDKVPTHYGAQIMWGMGILGLDVCHLGVLSGAGNDGRPNLAFASYTVRFNRRAFDYIAEQVELFLDDLDALKRKQAA